MENDKKKNYYRRREKNKDYLVNEFIIVRGRREVYDVLFEKISYIMFIIILI